VGAQKGVHTVVAGRSDGAAPVEDGQDQVERRLPRGHVEWQAVAIGDWGSAINKAGPKSVLREHGLLLLADNTLPSITTIIAGEPIRGSWWGHPQSHEIFGAARRLVARSDVVAVPLVNGKITFVDRRLWPALLTVALARDEWQ